MKPVRAPFVRLANLYIAVLSLTSQSRELKACSCINPGFLIVNSEVLPAEPIMLSIETDWRPAHAFRMLKFHLLAADGGTIPLHVVSHSTDGLHISLRPESPLKPARYEVAIDEPRVCPQSDRFCEIVGFGARRSLVVSNESAKHNEFFAAFEPESASFDGSSCDRRTITLKSPNLEPPLDDLFLARATFIWGVRFYWLHPGDDGKLRVGAGNCGRQLPLDFVQSGQLDLYRFEHQHLQALSSWSFSIPPPPGWSAKRYKAVRDCSDAEIAAQHPEHTGQPSAVIPPMDQVWRGCIAKSKFFKKANWDELREVLYSAADFTSAQAHFKALPLDQLGVDLPLEAVIRTEAVVSN